MNVQYSKTIPLNFYALRLVNGDALNPLLFLEILVISSTISGIQSSSLIAQILYFWKADYSHISIDNALEFYFRPT